jgi:hypothetical protein
MVLQVANRDIGQLTDIEPTPAPNSGLADRDSASAGNRRVPPGRDRRAGDIGQGEPPLRTKKVP